ncbi:hypothetical protein LJ655_23895 [Paraburkholderia sp. MMS20-SJTN17]|uniref:Uncharacterized protein n=1 Tax=Paraburkholderia translucens TaxID=2886945 RepID=A0ABS8KJE9_9BURK|nr:hypothetical protein [Paraburkholderia sp. MMS20-SJTN17]MCC8404878.1 hypothetical protein [Paraburkholderia sp. MMS20-SJTN17]
MNDTVIPLRTLVDKWLAPTRTTPAHVMHTGRMAATRARYVRLEGAISSGPLTIVFFRHGNGSWDVFPPVVESPAMSARFLA